MKLLDPRKLQKALVEHKKRLEKPREPLDKMKTSALLVSQIERVAQVVETLDGSALAILKREVEALYERSLHAQIAHGEAQNFQIGNAFVIRRHEQEELMIRELRVKLGEALENMRLAASKKDFLRLFSYLGGIMGAVGE